jgi:hypothetical protein
MIFSEIRRSFPHISPVRSYRDARYGMVDVYHVKQSTWRRLTRKSENGAQALFIDNGARECNPNQYGIKLFNECDLSPEDSQSDAWAAFWRQREAHREQVAPPVRRMVQIRFFDGLGRLIETVWGYQTSIAVANAPDYECGLQEDIFTIMLAIHGDRNARLDFCRALGIGVKDIPSPMWFSRNSHMTDTKMRRAMLGVSNRFDKDILGVLLGWEEHDEIDCLPCQSSCDWTERLRNLDLNGSPADSNAIPHNFRGDRRMAVYREALGGNDLHYGNVGWWKFKTGWRTVCFDFGHHFLAESRGVRLAKA